MRISDWSSDVCSSDLLVQFPIAAACDSHRPDETQPFAAIVIFIGEEVLGDFHPRPGARAIGNREQRRGDQRGKEEHDLEQPPPVAAHQPQPVDRDGHEHEVEADPDQRDRKSTRLNSSPYCEYRMPYSVSK